MQVEKIKPIESLPIVDYQSFHSFGVFAFIIGAIASGGAFARAIRLPQVNIRIIVSEMLVALFTTFILMTAFSTLGLPLLFSAWLAAAIGMLGEKGYVFLVSLCKAIINAFLKALGGSIGGDED